MGCEASPGAGSADSPDPEELLRRFAAAYRGPHRPEDALGWLRQPDAPGPSGASPPSAEAARLRRDLYLQHPPAGAHEQFRAAQARIAADAALAAEALSAAGGRQEAAGPPAPRPATAAPAESRRATRVSRRWAALGALTVLAGAGAVAAGLALAPRPPAPDPPIRLSAALWSGHGSTAASSPVLAAHGSALMVRLTCRGQGRVLLAVDGSIRSLICRAGATIRDDQLFQGRHEDFLLSLSLVDTPSWTASVQRVLPDRTG